MREISVNEVETVTGGEALAGPAMGAGGLSLAFTALAVVAAPVMVVPLVAAATVTGAIALGCAYFDSAGGASGSAGRPNTSKATVLEE